MRHTGTPSHIRRITRWSEVCCTYSNWRIKFAVGGKTRQADWSRLHRRSNTCTLSLIALLVQYILYNVGHATVLNYMETLLSSHIARSKLQCDVSTSSRQSLNTLYIAKENQLYLQLHKGEHNCSYLLFIPFQRFWMLWYTVKVKQCMYTLMPSTNIPHKAWHKLLKAWSKWKIFRTLSFTVH